MTAPEISVVICAHDEGRWDEIGAALRSVAEQTVPAAEVIVVVDNNARLLGRLQTELGVDAKPLAPDAGDLPCRALLPVRGLGDLAASG